MNNKQTMEMIHKQTKQNKTNNNDPDTAHRIIKTDDPRIYTDAKEGESKNW